MPVIPVTVVVEGPTDTPIAQRILRHVGFDVGPILVRNGKAGIDSRISGYNRAAAHGPWLILRDLDYDAPCPGELVRRLLPSPAEDMRFRVAVRQMEAWLLGDRDQLANYLSVSLATVPADPEHLQNAKLALINVARKSRRRSVRRDLVPLEGTTAPVGPGYLARITEYVTTHWRPDVAAASCDSLERCLQALRRWEHC